MEEFWLAAKSFGFGFAAMVIMAVVGWKFFTKSFYPHLLKQIEDANNRADKQAKDSLEKSNELAKAFLAATSEQRKEFLVALADNRALVTTQRELQETMFGENREMLHGQQLVFRGIAESLARIEEQGKRHK